MIIMIIIIIAINDLCHNLPDLFGKNFDGNHTLPVSNRESDSIVINRDYAGVKLPKLKININDFGFQE